MGAVHTQSSMLLPQLQGKLHLRIVLVSLKFIVCLPASDCAWNHTVQSPSDLQTFCLLLNCVKSTGKTAFHTGRPCCSGGPLASGLATAIQKKFLQNKTVFIHFPRGTKYIGQGPICMGLICILAFPCQLV